MAKEYNYEKEVDCRWNCLSNYAGADSRQYNGKQDYLTSVELNMTAYINSIRYGPYVADLFC